MAIPLQMERCQRTLTVAETIIIALTVHTDPRAEAECPLFKTLQGILYQPSNCIKDARTMMNLPNFRESEEV
jgi:hypothetical protein